MGCFGCLWEFPSKKTYSYKLNWHGHGKWPICGIICPYLPIISMVITIARGYRVYSNPETDSVWNLEMLRFICLMICKFPRFLSFLGCWNRLLFDAAPWVNGVWTGEQWDFCDLASCSLGKDPFDAFDEAGTFKKNQAASTRPRLIPCFCRGRRIMLPPVNPNRTEYEC